MHIFIEILMAPPSSAGRQIGHGGSKGLSPDTKVGLYTVHDLLPVEKCCCRDGDEGMSMANRSAGPP